MQRKSLLAALLELLVTYRPDVGLNWYRRWQWLLPTPGNVLFTLAIIAALFWAQSAGAEPFRVESAISTGTIAYQGYLTDSSGNPLTATLEIGFRLYSAATGGTPLWAEEWTGGNGVAVNDGLFNVMLGSLTPIPQSVITGNTTLFLGITVGADSEMTPRVQLGSVPFAIQALSIPNGSITAEKIADGAVTQTKAPLLIESLDNDMQLQRGRERITVSQDKQELSMSIDFVPNFSDRPVVVVQPAWDYTVHAIATLHGGIYCNGDTCQVYIRRTDGGTWTAGQFQTIDWIAVGPK